MINPATQSRVSVKSGQVQVAMFFAVFAVIG